MKHKLNLLKDKEQQKHLAAWQSNGRFGTSIAATGLGKTRMGLLAILDILEDNPHKKALVIVPTENLRDNEWINEFSNWNCTHLLPQVEFQCIQSAYKMTNRSWDIVVVDEVHTTLSPEYRKFYENNAWANIYCLTATPPENDEYRKYLHSVAPLTCETDINEALDLGLISEYKLYNLGVNFTAEEAKEYNRVDAIFNKATNFLGGRFDAFKNATKYRNSGDAEQKKWANIFYIMMQKRKKLCYSASAKLDVTKQLIDRYSDRKALVFSESIDFATELHEKLGDICVTFHSKMKIKEKREALKSFGDGRTKKRVISSVKALNAGLNVPDCSLGICCAGSSKALDGVQRTGRTLRLREGKTALYINLYVRGSQEVKWVRKRTKDDFQTEWIESINDIEI